jgi:hypothetical protein
VVVTFAKRNHTPSIFTNNKYAKMPPKEAGGIFGKLSDIQRDGSQELNCVISMTLGSDLA